MFLLKLFRYLNEAGVGYCLVGGVAVSLHGVPRMTFDVDLVLMMEDADLKKAAEVFGDLNLVAGVDVDLASLADPELRAELIENRNLKALAFTDPDRPLHEVDVVIETHIGYEELLDRAEVLEIEGTPVPVISRADLIAMKTASGRTQDLDDVKHLKRLDP